MGPRAEKPTADDILSTMREIVIAADVLTKALDRRLRCANGNGIGYFGLRFISDAGRSGLSQIDLSRLACISPSVTTKLVDASEKSGIVMRIAHPTDRRINMITLTIFGQTLIDQIVAGLMNETEYCVLVGGQHEYLKTQLLALQQSHRSFP